MAVSTRKPKTEPETPAAPVAVEIPPFVVTDVRHPTRYCRWCGEHFMPVWPVWMDEDTKKDQWLCPTVACHTRQLHYAMKHATEPRYIYIPTPAGVELLEAKTRHVLWGGSAGAAKSHGLRWEMYHWMQRIPDFRGLLMRRTYPELESTHLSAMQAEEGLLPGFRYVAGQRMMVNDENGAFCRAGHCDSPKDYNKLLSTEYDRITLDEGVTFMERQITEISGRRRTSNPLVKRLMGGAGVRIGTNPGGEGHDYLHSAYIKHDLDPFDYPKYNPALYQFIPAFLRDNPYADDEYEETLEQQHKDRAKQLLDGDWNAYMGSFLPMFNQSHIVTDMANV